MKQGFEDKIIPVHLPAAFTQMCIANGHNPTQVLDGVELSLDDMYDIHTRFNYNQISRLICNGLKLSKDASLGIKFGKHIRLSHLGTMGVALMCSPTLKHTLDVVEKFTRLIDPTLQVIPTVNKGWLKIKFGKKIPLGVTYSYTQEMLAVAIIRLLSVLLETTALPDLQLSFNYPKPAHADSFGLINAVIRWQQPECHIILSIDPLDSPLPSGDLPAYERAWQACERELAAAMTERNHWSLTLKLIILNNLRQIPTADQMARLLNLSRRTFFRKLAEMDTSYEKEINSVRAKLAEDYLIRGSVSLTEVAYLLGYNDASNFTKAFKRWYGLPPKKWQEKHAASMAG